MEQVEADGLHKTYGDTVALDGVSLSVDAGEVFALVGPNGAGKTTLVRCLTGTARPTDGEARLLGTSPDEVDKTRVSVLPQEFSPPERLTPDELVGYYGSLYPDDETRAADTVVDEMGLSDARETRYADLSGGQKSRLRVAVSLVNDPDVVFLDEPTTGIDPEGREDVWRVVERLADQGTTVFLTTHYMREVERLADRVALIANGSLVEVGETDAVVRQHAGEPRLIVRTVGPADEAVEAVSTDGDVTVSVEDDELVFEGVAVDRIGERLSTLTDAGVEYDEVRWREPGLEEAYLRLTGER
ncbi:MAG: ABC transporter ATP-binding protein [Halobacteriales archaeon]